MTLLSPWLLATLGLAAVLGLLWLLARGARWSGLATPVTARRLAVQEVTPLDSRRRLLLVRVDQREVLLLTGQGPDLVVGWLP